MTGGLRIVFLCLQYIMYSIIFHIMYNIIIDCSFVFL
jgi:hypothetical protein